MPVPLHLPLTTPTLVLGQPRMVLTFSTVLLSEDGVRPDHKANLQGSPSTCSVTPSSEVCRQEMPVRGREGEGSGENLGLGWEGKGNREERTEGGACVN